MCFNAKPGIAMSLVIFDVHTNKFCGIALLGAGCSMGRNQRVAESKSADNLIADMSEDSRILLERTKSWADCKVRTADGFEFELHKMTLMQESVVLG